MKYILSSGTGSFLDSNMNITNKLKEAMVVDEAIVDQFENWIPIPFSPNWNDVDKELTLMEERYTEDVLKGDSFIGEVYNVLLEREHQMFVDFNEMVEKELGD